MGAAGDSGLHIGSRASLFVYGWRGLTRVRSEGAAGAAGSGTHTAPVSVLSLGWEERLEEGGGGTVLGGSGVGVRALFERI